MYLLDTKIRGFSNPDRASPASRLRAAPSAPALVKREAYPPASTLYVRIKLGQEDPAPPMTGIFLCANYQPQPQVDLILYLQGFRQGHLPLAVSIEQYWKISYFRLREELNAGRKNVVLVAPTLGPRSEAGTLITRDGFDVYLDKVMAALKQYGPYSSMVTPPAVGKVILACHSGGGFPMILLATSRQRYTAHIQECWGFDCLYGNIRGEGVEKAWAKWATSRPDAKLFVHYLGSTEKRSKKLMQEGIPNVFVRRSSAPDHNHVPITHWRERMRSAPFLQDA